MEFSIKIPQEKFTSHLNAKDNNRIILSGKFGSGKTYFLKKYFEANNSYDVIHLFPVNYSITSNKDIFELIKHDILFELLGKDVEFDKLSIPHLWTFLNYAKKNGYHILAPFLNLVPNIGKSLYTIYEELQELSEKYLDEHKKAQVDDKANAIKYLEGFTLNQGCVYEEDFFTQLIQQLVEQLKKTGDLKKTESVLIIDDLDRIDPEHIFRILNVFAAHYDLDGSENKFGFDKIILVCDINNIREIFHYRYGSSTDFSGYIDKFYSKEVFDFDNADGLSENVLALLRSIEIKRILDPQFDFKRINNFSIINTAYILTAMIYANKLTIRRLKKIIGHEYYPNEYYLNLANYRKIRNYTFDCITIIDFLMWVFGDYDELIKAVRLCEDFETDYFHDNIRTRFCSFLIPILDYENSNLKISDNEYSYGHGASNQRFVYKVQTYGDMHNKILCNVTSIQKSSNTEEKIVGININYFSLLLTALEKIKNQGIISYAKGK